MVGVGLIALAVAIAYAAWRLAAAWERVGVPVVPPAPVASDAVPGDIVAWAATFGEAWAIDDALETARERYRALKDWNLVRRAVGIGQVT